MGLSGYPEAWEADVLLRDGHPVHVRPITPADGEALRAFHRSLSARTVYLRFFSAKPELTDADVERFTVVDHVDRVALVALDRDVIVGVGRYDAVGGGAAEVAFVVRDDLQGLGLGSVLLEHLAAAARERGLTRFVAEVLPENGRMLTTFREAGYAVAQSRNEDALSLAFDLEPTARSVEVMTAREHRAEARSMARMLRPSTVAVVGRGAEPGDLSDAVLAHLARADFTGHVIAVDPDAVPGTDGTRARDLGEAPAGIDLAVVTVPAAHIAGVVDAAGAAHVHGLVVTGGFDDDSDSGRALQAELATRVTRTGMRLVGPNALGIINAHPEVRLNASLVPRLPRHGHVGFFCQSGALGISILDRFGAKGLGVSTVVSAGNRTDVSGNDLLQFWEEDPDTEAVALHLETIGNARKFARLVRRISRVKPVVMVRSGGAGRRHPLGHAVATTGLGQGAVDQVLRDCGLVVVEDVEAMIDVLRVCVGQALPPHPAIAVVSNSDALAAMAQNAITDQGLRSAGEPVVVARASGAEAYAAVVEAAADREGVGAVLAIHVPPIEGEDADLVMSALDRCRSGLADAPPIVAVLGRAPAQDLESTVPMFFDVEDAVAALAAAHRLSAWRTADEQRERADDPAWEAEPPTVDADSLADDAAARLITAVGRTPVVIDLDSVGATGFMVRLDDDPLFGPVVAVGVDDAVAEALDDRQHRLAPVTSLGARDMLDRLGAVPAALQGAGDAEAVLTVMARLVADVSALHLRVPGVRRVDVRRATVRANGDVSAGAVEIALGPAPVVEPTARRL